MRDVEIESKGGAVVCRLVCELDHHTAKPIRQKIDERVRAEKPKEVVLDFSGVGFMDSSGIGLILGRVELCEKIGASLILRGLFGTVGKLIRMSGVGKIKCIRLDD